MPAAGSITGKGSSIRAQAARMDSSFASSTTSRIASCGISIYLKVDGFDREPLTEEEQRYLAHYRQGRVAP
jgi:hypothetical protein